ncbi:PepSY domain-containing protein [Nonomuraea sp. NPDC050404]|uniref:PepSY domain-containing protein n=1 Tax=Nonomuraea sp. NPDC050404 TaxID=3155783 RepID=UPI0033F60528
MRNTTKHLIAGAGIIAALLGGSAFTAASANAADRPDRTATARTAAQEKKIQEISEERAVEIAKLRAARAGLTVVKAERVTVDGVPTWRVELQKGRTKYVVDIDARTEKVVSYDRTRVAAGS